MTKLRITITVVLLSSVSYGGLSPKTVDGLSEINASLLQAKGYVNSAHLPPDITINFIGGNGAAEFLHSVQALESDQKTQILASIGNASSKIQDLLGHPGSVNLTKLGSFKAGLMDIKTNDEGILKAHGAPQAAIDFLNGKFDELLKIIAEKPSPINTAANGSGKSTPSTILKSNAR